MILKEIYSANSKRPKVKIALITEFLLLLTGCDGYDSYGECMYEWEIDALFAEFTCPECNDWRKLRKEAVDRCYRYIEPWEM